MARDAVEISDSGSEAVTSSKSKSMKTKKAAETPAKDDRSEVEDTDEGDENEEEYEIENIVDSQRSGKGKFRYLVKWKGYEENHNSWVEEDDAGGAQELISEYWRQNKKKSQAKVPRKSLPSMTAEPSPEASASVTKKRGRSKAKKEVSDDEGASDGERVSAAKRARKSNGASKSTKRSASTAAMDVDEVPDGEIGDMLKYKHLESWEDLINSVDTVERNDNGELLVYFTLKADGDRHMQSSLVCRKKFPQLLLQFYEDHLRWKQIDASDA